ncbi:MAG: hypothetical protein WB789_04250 [Thermoplasmata archaeon]
MRIRKRVGQTLIVLGLALIVVSFFFRYDTTCQPSNYNGTGPPPPTSSCVTASSWTVTGWELLFGGIVLLPVGGFIAWFRTGK